jgi:hypothetical protein
MTRTNAKFSENTLSYAVPSSRPARGEYLVELASFDANGECCCRHFVCRLLPILKKGISPADAVASGLVELEEGDRPENALRCKHIVEARGEFADVMIRAIDAANRAQSSKTPRAA